MKGADHMNGKQKCTILRQIRCEIAKKNDISISMSECKHEGDCRGTCQKCESELAELERKLSARRKTGRQVLVAGIATSLIATSYTACSDPFARDDMELTGDMIVEESSTNGELQAENDKLFELDGDLPVVKSSEE